MTQLAGASFYEGSRKVGLLALFQLVSQRGVVPILTATW